LRFVGLQSVGMTRKPCHKHHAQCVATAQITEDLVVRCRSRLGCRNNATWGFSEKAPKGPMDGVWIVHPKICDRFLEMLGNTQQHRSSQMCISHLKQMSQDESCDAHGHGRLVENHWVSTPTPHRFGAPVPCPFFCSSLP
jgi:hypothetical protein